MIVNPQLPNGHVTFCDDVRYELNNKRTLVGVYGTEMRLFGEPPLMLSALNAVVDFMVDPQSLPMKGDIRIIKSGSEEVLCQQELEFRNPDADLPNIIIHPEELMQEYVGLSSHFIMRNVVIDEPCRLKVRAFIGKDEIRIGSLRICFAPPSEMQPSS